MKTTLEKWLFAVGVFLFVWFLVPELNASAAEQYYYERGSIFITHTVDGNVHTFSGSGFNDVSFTLTDTYPYIVCAWTNKGSFAVICPLTHPVVSLIDASSYDYGVPIIAQINYKGPYFSIETDHRVYGNFKINSNGSYLDSQITFSFFEPSDYMSVSNSICYSSVDLYFDGTYENISDLVFQHPLPPTPTPSLQQQFQTAVEMTNLEAVMNQVVGLAPLLIGLLITLISFSKGLGLLSETLRKV